MDVTLKQATILMGDFHNMLITDEFTAIHYDIYTGPQKENQLLWNLSNLNIMEEL